MPRKSNEKINIIENNIEYDNELSSKSVKKVTKTKQDKSPVNDDIEKVKTSSSKKTKSTTSNSKTTSKRTKSSSQKNTKTATPKSSTSKTSKKAENKTTSKSTKTPTQKRSTGTKKKINKDVSNEKQVSPIIDILEYYDLPYKYNHTIIKLLAQTPKTLFVYWEISDDDIENYKRQYGENFFYITKPVLLVHNLTLNQTFEVEVNDFANCWYITTQDSDCKFDIELCRRFIRPATNKITSEHKEISDYMYITKSNDLQSPNDHVLLEKLENTVKFKNVYNNETSVKNISSFKELNDIYKFYQDTYQEFYNSDPNDNNNKFLKNPSSKFNF